MDHILTANTITVAAVVPDFDNILETPLLAVDVESCNCSNFPDTDKVFLPPLDDTPERENTQEQTERNENNLDDGQSRNNSDDEHSGDESEGIVCISMFCFINLC